MSAIKKCFELGANPIVIVGAARSGTNMLRDVLTRLQGICTWPCDEINYIWRYGNARYPSDEFTPNMASVNVQHYIRNRFKHIAANRSIHTVIEKTCANSLRLGFVDRILPEASYIFIRRNGIDVIASARNRWKAQFDLFYILKKARFVPLKDVPYYTSKYFWNHLYRLIHQRQRLAFWGPRINGMTELLNNYSLEEVCAIQWKRCVENAADILGKMPQGKQIEVVYEDFVRSPVEELEKILYLMDIKVESSNIQTAVFDVNNQSVGKGYEALGRSTIEQILPLIQSTLSRYGYA